MELHQNRAVFFTILILLLFVIACNDSQNNSNKDIAKTPEQMDKLASERIEKILQSAIRNSGKLDDSIRLHFADIVNKVYEEKNYETIWSHKEKWEPLTDSLILFVQNAALYGLFPKDYHYKNLSSLKEKLDTDSLKKLDAVLWTKADLMLTDAFLHLANDLKKGRLNVDSSLLRGEITKDNFLLKSFDKLLSTKRFTETIVSLEPSYKGYWDLKAGIKPFLDSMDTKAYTYVKFPYKKDDEKDSLLFVKTIQKRLNESGCIDFVSVMPDSTQLSDAIKKYQQKKGLTVDGKVGPSVVKTMNLNDVEKFKRIAITLDRYKLMPDTLPDKYIWVNLPGYYLQIWDSDTVALESKVICGKPETRTPVLESSITDMVTYPTWTVPNSIIVKQYLPKLKNNPGYLARLGLHLVDSKGNTVDPGNVNWEKYSKGIPYKVMQNSGDNNALGIMKFNFNNPYAVYLHDTNQRYLFKKSSRALSHGCVRVEQWQGLAFYLARNDSMNLKQGDSLRYTTDSIVSWLAEKKRKRIDVKNHIPLYIKYFSCEGKDGKIKFYDDIYGEDKAAREKYFSNK